MNESLGRALHKALELQQIGEKKIAGAAGGLFDVLVVTDVSVDGVWARPVVPAGAAPRKVAAIAGIRILLGDEVVVARVGGQEFILGAIRSEAGAFSSLQATPILVPSVVRSGNATWVGPTDFSSLRVTIPNLDPGTVYLVEATAGAYLTPSAGGVKVGMGVRIGYASDTASVGSPEWGPGHANTVPTWATARSQRLVGSTTSVQVTGRGWSSAAGSNTIGDGSLDVIITPLYTAGRI